MSFQPREFGQLYYGWKLTHLPPGEWRDLVQELHDTPDPVQQLNHAKRILKHGPLKAWCMVFTLARYSDSSPGRWTLLPTILMSDRKAFP